MSVTASHTWLYEKEQNDSSLPRSIGLSNYLLLAYFIALYLMPYFRVMFEAPTWLVVREILFFFLLIRFIFHKPVLRAPVWIYLYVIALIADLLISENLSIAFLTLRTLLQFLGVYLFTKKFVTQENQIIFFCKFFYGIGLIAVISIVMQAIVGPIPILNMYDSLDEGSMRFGLVRLSTIFGNTITSGMLALMFLVQVIFVNRQSTIKCLLFVASFLGVVLTVSKAPIVVMAVIVTFYLLKFLLNLHVAVKLAASLCILLLLASFVFLTPSFDDRLNTVSYMDDVTLADQMLTDSEQRFYEKPIIGINKMLDISPLTFLVGAGYDVAGQAAANEGDGIRPHNAFFEIFMNMGLFGAIIYAYMFSLVAKIAFRIKTITRLDLQLKGLAVGLAASLLSSLVVDPHVTQVLMVPTFFLLAVSNAYDKLTLNRSPC